MAPKKKSKVDLSHTEKGGMQYHVTQMETLEQLRESFHEYATRTRIDKPQTQHHSQKVLALNPTDTAASLAV
jgi:hypothetical protein